MVHCHNLVLLGVLDSFEILVEENQLSWIFSLLAKLLIDLSELSTNLLSLLNVVAIDFLEDLLNEVLTHLDKPVVQLVALNKEHVDSDLIRGLLLDLVDGVKIDVDLSHILFSVLWSLGNELINMLLSVQKESVVFIDVDGLLCHLQILEKNLRDLFRGVDNQLIFNVDLPEVVLVAVCNLVVSSWDLVDLLNHLCHHFDKLLLNFSWLFLEVNLILGDVQL